MNSKREIKIAALTGGKNTPSARFRIRQYAQRLGRHNVVVEEHIPFFEKSCGLPSPFIAAARIPALFKSRNADAVWLNKELVQGYPTFERFLKRPRVLDADDAIWLNWPMGGYGSRKIAKAMDAIIAGNSYIADYFGQYCSNVHIVPTAIDLERYTKRENVSEGKFIVGWTGLACNYKYLEPIAGALKEFLDSHDDAELMLLSNRRWETTDLPADKVRFVPWSKDNEATALHEMSVGLMPLADDKWAKGKCSFKMLQYMASGVPVIVSPVGMNADVLAKGKLGYGAVSVDDWYDALQDLYDSRDRQAELGDNGRAVIEEFYNADAVAEQLAGIFRSLL